MTLAKRSSRACSPTIWASTRSAPRRKQAVERCRRLAKRLDADAVDFAAPAAIAAGALPRCNDPDDQKFLELALAARADVLVTKGQALLDPSRRKLPFRIAAPQALGAL